MEAFRKIVTVRNNILKIVLPDHYNDKQVELIILPAEEEVSRVEDGKADYYSKFYGVMKSDLTSEEIDKKLKALREEWNRDIS